VYLRYPVVVVGEQGPWTDDEIAAYVEAYSQPGELRGGLLPCWSAARRSSWRRRPEGPGADHGAVGDSDEILPYACQQPAAVLPEPDAEEDEAPPLHDARRRTHQRKIIDFMCG
jgi:hypothetical protein